jgi:phosphopentomutase
VNTASDARRAIIIVLDSVGIGELPDAHLFGDEGSNTLVNLANKFPEGLRLPNLGRLGLGNITTIRGVPADDTAIGGWGKCAERSPAKDTTLGHWEIAGVVSTQAFPLYPEGFPPEVMEPFEAAIGSGTLGNRPASGTQILEELGDEHVRTGKPIVYTSGDSVFQIAAHEEAYGLERLYEICEIARRMLQGKHRVGRVIARPFIGPSGAYERTRNRRDYSVPPPEPTILDLVKDAGMESIGVGKIGDIFDHTGLTREVHGKGNEPCILATIDEMRSAGSGLIFTNLVDTDMMYGHRNDSPGYRAALEHIDSFVPKILNALRAGDLLIFTADHGCDPTTPSTDHSREYVPLLVYSRAMRGGVDLGTRETFADVAMTVAEYLGVNRPKSGTSFLEALGLRR